jgi:hypothetical protein
MGEGSLLCPNKNDIFRGRAPVAHAYYPTYSGDRDQEDPRQTVCKTLSQKKLPQIPVSQKKKKKKLKNCKNQITQATRDEDRRFTGQSQPTQILDPINNIPVWWQTNYS